MGNWRLGAQFQFHDGSIKGAFKSIDIPIWYIFQFHDGSIKGFNSQILIHMQHYFNSTMVRLKVLMNPTQKRKAKEFQFHDGSIKGDLLNAIDSQISLFQFHDGSIKGIYISC